jgi:hypothetical protein
VPDQAIALIRGLCAVNDCLYPDNETLGGRGNATVRAAPLAIGASAQIMAGPMADLTGICEWSDGRRVRLELWIMGRSVAVTVSQERVQAVVPPDEHRSGVARTERRSGDAPR